MGDVVSWISGVFLLIGSIMVIKAYWPGRAKIHPDPAAFWLCWAIVLSFSAAAGNTLYWQVGGQVLVPHVFTVDAQRALGDWLDLFFKGAGGLAALMHLKAMQARLPKSEQAQWSLFEMPWYPERRKCLARRGPKESDDDV